MNDDREEQLEIREQDVTQREDDLLAGVNVLASEVGDFKKKVASRGRVLLGVCVVILAATLVAMFIGFRLTTISNRIELTARAAAQSSLDSKAARDQILDCILEPGEVRYDGVPNPGDCKKKSDENLVDIFAEIRKIVREELAGDS